MKDCIDRVRTVHPLIHCITNYVTVNDCANILLACGASPIMADDPAEAAEITAICSGLVLNIGTLNSQTISAMFLAGKEAAARKHAIVFDPVGAGASGLRAETAQKILNEISPDVVRCNSSELKTLMDSGSVSRGVDVSELDRITEKNYRHAAGMIRDFSVKYHCVTAVSGAIDLIASPGGQVCALHGGHPMMEAVTGCGCMLTALTAAYAAANQDCLFQGVLTASALMKAAGSLAHERLLSGEGNASFRTRMIDAVCHTGYEEIERLVRYEML